MHESQNSLPNLVEDVSEYKFVPSEVVMSSDHQEEDLALRSPVIIDTVGLSVLMSLNSCSKFNKNESNSRLFLLEER